MADANQHARNIPSNWMNAIPMPTPISDFALCSTLSFNFMTQPSWKYRSLNRGRAFLQSLVSSSMYCGIQQLDLNVRFELCSTQSAGPVTPQQCNFRWTLSQAITSSGSDFLIEASSLLVRVISRSDLKQIAAIPTASSMMKIIAKHTANYCGGGGGVEGRKCMLWFHWIDRSEEQINGQ